jgi:hypothetical protein
MGYAIHSKRRRSGHNVRNELADDQLLRAPTLLGCDA